MSLDSVIGTAKNYCNAISKTNDFQSLPFDKRKKESTHILTKYPDKVGIIVQKSTRCYEDIELDKQKFLVPRNITMGQFLFIIRKRLKLRAEKAIYMFTENTTIPPTSFLISNIYNQNVNQDGFLYMYYTSESTFG
uniref:Autophagy protein Atg8 ubiquitin-like protein n=1 Tax=Megaviridae environmental sample TaxID=1737588 RepID=A0A5J6VMR0_9VIRU|nr:MAG: autophagy protein Atg8 ubiquitin-like protein [Megaviridae environmental sample]